jgi:hypothetical protein
MSDILTKKERKVMSDIEMQISERDLQICDQSHNLSYTLIFHL